MSWGEVFKITSCRVVVIGKVASLVGATVSITDGVATTTGVFGSDLVLSFELASRKTYTVSAGGFSKVIKPKAGDFLEVELGGFDRLWLLENGYKREEEIPLWVANDLITAYPRNLSQINTYGPCIYSSDYFLSYFAIDVTEYNTIWVEFMDETLYDGQGGGCYLYLSSNNTVVQPAAGDKCLNKFQTFFPTGMLVPFDIRDINGSYFIVARSNTGANARNVGIKNLFLAKDTVNSFIPKSNTKNFAGGAISALTENTAVENMIKYQNTWLGNWTVYQWTSTSANTTEWVKITFDSPQVVNFIRLDTSFNYPCAQAVLQGSNDNTNWTDLHIFSDLGSSKCARFATFANKVAYKYYRVVYNGKTSDRYGASLIMLGQTDNVAQVYNDLN